jgi:hypothetical protein
MSRYRSPEASPAIEECAMKTAPSISAKLAMLAPNHIGVLAWSLLAHPQAGNRAGGIPGQPDPDTPQPGDPNEPGEPTLPDEPPPTPMA